MIIEQTVEVRSNFDVELVESAGSDEFICKAARVSTLGAESIESKESEGLIRFLLMNRHGSPFEHGMMTFRISAPIFVWREFMRHRIGFSYNEESGRYKELNGVFYVPSITRNLIQVGKPGSYSFEPGSGEQHHALLNDMIYSYEIAWERYQRQLQAGTAKEVARMVLPVSIYSTAYVTCNPRSMMSFLSLRTKYEGSTFPSFPQWEINQVANQMEDIFKDLFPHTWRAFNEAGRVSP